MECEVERWQHTKIPPVKIINKIQTESIEKIFHTTCIKNQLRLPLQLEAPQKHGSFSASNGNL